MYIRLYARVAAAPRRYSETATSAAGLTEDVHHFGTPARRIPLRPLRLVPGLNSTMRERSGISDSAPPVASCIIITRHGIVLRMYTFSPVVFLAYNARQNGRATFGFMDDLGRFIAV